jgi:carbon storage regulator CsrA
MLVLSRRLNERIVLPGLNVTIEGLSIKGNAVRLAVAAPDGIKIMREQVLHGPRSRMPPPPAVSCAPTETSGNGARGGDRPTG